jgi:predicted Zn-dependent peptidase
MNRYDHLTLDNGLNIVGEFKEGAQSMAAGYFVRTGARDETAAISGCSHFLEHMMFKGSDRRSAEDVNREFDEIGANYNAFTSEENTVYYGAVLPEFQSRVLDLLTDMMRPTLRQDDFDVEKKVIIEEIALYQDRPRFTVMDEARLVYYAGHPLGNSVLGTTASITALKRDQMHEYFARRYSPNNLSLVLTGAYNWEAAVGRVRHGAGHWKPADAPRHLDSPPAHPGVKVIRNDKFNRVHLCLVAPGVSAQDPARHAADAVAEALGAPEGSRLYWALVDPGLVDTASLYHSEEDGTGAYYAYLSCEVERAQEVLDRTRAVLQAACREGISEEELERAKRKLASGHVLQGETPYGRLMQVGSDWQYRREIRPLSDAVDAQLRVTIQEANALLHARPFDQMAVVALGPIEALS